MNLVDEEYVTGFDALSRLSSFYLPMDFPLWMIWSVVGCELHPEYPSRGEAVTGAIPFLKRR